MARKPNPVTEYICRRYFDMTFREVVLAMKKSHPGKSSAWYYYRVYRLAQQAMKKPPPPAKNMYHRIQIVGDTEFLDRINLKERASF